MKDYSSHIAAAKAVAPYHDDGLVGTLTADVTTRGHSVLQIFQFGTEREHVSELLRLADFPADGLILDMACGVGAVAALMWDMRPDLGFVLQNCSAAQLRMAPGMPKVCGDMHSVDMPDGILDGVMVNYAMGHGDLSKLMQECARLLDTGGTLFVYDLWSPDTAGFASALGYVSYAPADVCAAAMAAGLWGVLTFHDWPLSPLCREYAAESPLFAQTVAKARPVSYRFIKM